MIANFRDDLQDLFRCKLEQRDINWLWLVLIEEGFRFPLDQFGAGNMRDSMASFIKNKNLMEWLDGLRTQAFLPDHVLDWIKKDDRQMKWLLHRLTKNSNIPFNHYPESLTIREHIFSILDWWPESLSLKRREMEHLQRDWATIQQEDKIFSWFKKDGTERKKCEIAWEWYRENHPYPASKTPRFFKLDDIFLFLDASEFKAEEKRYHVDQIKKELKRRQSISNLQGKSQTNLALSEEIRNQLNALAAREKKTMVSVVEQLIHFAYNNGMPSESID